MTPIKERMKFLGIRQVDMILVLRERGITVQPPELSIILNGISTSPKARRVMSACNEIVATRERELVGHAIN